MRDVIDFRDVVRISDGILGTGTYDRQSCQKQNVCLRKTLRAAKESRTTLSQVLILRVGN